jgi:hypothetical protein
MKVISEKEYALIDCLEEVSVNYLNNTRGIEGLSSLLKRLILQLNEIDQIRRDSLFDLWSSIEIEYATMLSENRISLSKLEKKIVNDAVNQIVNLCSEIKKHYKCEEEDPLSWPYPEDVW